MTFRRPTTEEIIAAAQRHVAYGWARSPGSHLRGVQWTDEDVITYQAAFTMALAKQREQGVNK